MTPNRSVQSDPLMLAFAPVHKRAFGTATGLAAALLTFLATAIYLLRAPQPGFNLGLLALYFTGYEVTWRGAFVGAAWAGFTGFVMGWFLAFCRNMLLAALLFVVRTKAELEQTRDFLDHI